MDTPKHQKLLFWKKKSEGKKALPEGSDPKINAILIRTEAEVAGGVFQKFEPHALHATHPIFTYGTFSNLSQLVGIPLKTLRLAPTSDDDKDPQSSNVAAASLHRIVNPYKVTAASEVIDNDDFGLIAPAWEYPGAVLVVRADKLPLHAFHMEAISYFCAEFIGWQIDIYFAQLANHKASSNTSLGVLPGFSSSTSSSGDHVTLGPPRKQDVLARATPAKFRQWYLEFLGESIAGRPQWDWKSYTVDRVKKTCRKLASTGNNDELEKFGQQLYSYSEDQIKARPELAEVPLPWLGSTLKP